MLRRHSDWHSEPLYVLFLTDVGNYSGALSSLVWNITTLPRLALDEYVLSSSRLSIELHISTEALTTSES